MGNGYLQAKRSRGSPLQLWPPNAITPEQVIRHHCFKRRGGMGRQALATPLSYLHFVFHIKVKGITLKDPRVFIMFA
jgi:hypothetical protein